MIALGRRLAGVLLPGLAVVVRPGLLLEPVAAATRGILALLGAGAVTVRVQADGAFVVAGGPGTIELGAPYAVAGAVTVILGAALLHRGSARSLAQRILFGVGLVAAVAASAQAAVALALWRGDLPSPRLDSPGEAAALLLVAGSRVLPYALIWGFAVSRPAKPVPQPTRQRPSRAPATRAPAQAAGRRR